MIGGAFVFLRGLSQFRWCRRVPAASDIIVIVVVAVVVGGGRHFNVLGDIGGRCQRLNGHLSDNLREFVRIDAELLDVRCDPFDFLEIVAELRVQS